MPILLGMGINELSMNPQSIPAVKSMIRSLRMEDAQRLMNEVLKKTSAKEVVKLLEDAYDTVLSDTLFAA